MNIKLFFILLLFVVFTKSIWSQKVSDVTFNQSENNTIVVHYKISGAKFYQNFTVKLYLSTDGGETYIGPLKAVSGDVGENIKGGQRKIVWNIFNEVAKLEGNITFDVRIIVNESEIPKKIFTGITSSYSVPNIEYISYGIVVGQTRKIGWYGAVRLNMDYFKSSTDYHCDDTKIFDFDGDGYWEIDNKTLKPKINATCGLNFVLGENLYIFSGAGYGQKAYLWHFNDYSYSDDKLIASNYASHNDYELSGLLLEAGAMIRISKFILLHAGASVLSFKHMSLISGIAVEF